MRRVRIMAAMCCFLAMGSGLGGEVAAQALSTLQGTLVDESDAPLPGVSVKVTNVDTGYTRTVFTDANGRYSAPSLQPGLYSVEGSLQGLQTVKQDNIRLQVGQMLDVNLKMGVETMAEAITVTAEAPIIEVSRSSAAKYVTEEEIQNIPISGRDFVDFALLAPTVKAEPDRGGISLSGQRGTNSGLKLDGTEGKSAFFGYGRGGEATENEGNVVAQDSVKEFQVITTGFAPEFGQNGGGYVNVVTKSGTNEFRGTGFFLFRNQSFVADLPLSPFDEANDRSCVSDGGTVNCEPNEFHRTNWGASIGGPIIQDKTHFFVSYDQLTREEPRDAFIPIPGVYEAVEARFPGLLRGYQLDPATGEASAQFIRNVDNLILFGKIDHQLGANNTLSLRYNYTNYEFSTEDPQAESSKPEKTNAIVASLVSLIGNNAVNEFRFQYATDNFSRRSDFERDLNPPTPAQLDFIIGGNSVSLGKAYFFPIFTDETKIQIQDNFSYLFGEHDLKFGFDYQSDNASQLFAGFLDGRYEFRSLESFELNIPARARIYYGDASNPNFDETQSVLGIYAQDNWKPNSKLTLNFGVRWDGTFNPQGIEHLLDGTVQAPDGSTPDARDVPNDLNNFAPRVGFAYSLSDDGKDVLRGGAGRFFSRTPILLWASIVTSNGFVPGVVSANPTQPGFVPLGEPIDNNNAVPGTLVNLSLADEDFEDPETWRFNLGYEREVVTNWSVGADLIYAHGDSLQSNDELNRQLLGHDEFGRPQYSRTRPDPNFGQVFVRSSPGWSNYFAGTLNVNKRWSDNFQLQASYTYSVDKDSDDNERTATTVTITDISDTGFDYGTSTRDITHRLVFSGVAELPLEFRLSGVMFLQSGRPWTITDANSGVYGDPNGFVDEVARAIVNGELVDRNSERNEGFTKLDLRLAKFFDVSSVRLEAFAEVFNLFNTVTFDVNQFGNEAIMTNRDGTANPNFGLARNKNTNSDQRQFQLGARVTF